jgi:ribosomal protein S18 acetylase RimI-like enzyme
MLRADLPAVLAIEAQANAVPWKAADFEVFLREPGEGPPGGGAAASSGVSQAFAGIAANGPVGWVWANPEVQGFACVVGAADEAELQAIAVARDHWGRGVGSALMEALCGWAGVHAYAALHLEVREGNARARDFYARWGFVASGVRTRYYRNNGESALLLMKPLDKPGAPGAGQAPPA